jgi:hypothetical protein
MCLAQCACASTPLTTSENPKAAVTELPAHIVPVIQRKRPDQLRNIFAKALGLNDKGLCLELGKFPCIDVIHKVNLGGMDAYNQSQYRYTDDIDITGPIALERVALSACSQRAGIDIANPEAAKIYKDIKLSKDGRLHDNGALDASIQRLYQRVLVRNPSTEEVAALKDFYRRLYREKPIGAALNWMTLACFAVLTQVESVFY